MNLIQHSLVLGIRVYRLVLSPAQVYLFGATTGCRFTPTCSAYALEAVTTHGAIRGSALAVGRICRCHPWGAGGHDPVPVRSLSPTPNPAGHTFPAEQPLSFSWTD